MTAHPNSQTNTAIASATGIIINVNRTSLRIHHSNNHPTICRQNTKYRINPARMAKASCQRVNTSNSTASNSGAVAQ